MKSLLSEELKDHLAQEVTTLATCWSITRPDGIIFRFTDHDSDVTILEGVYEAAASMAGSDLKRDRTLAVDNMEAVVFLDSESISAEDLSAGLFDDSSIEMFLVNWEDISQGVLWVLKGWKLGHVETRDESATVELRGLTQMLSHQICDLYSETCRAEFGDERCGVDTNAPNMRQSGMVDSAENRQRFVVSSPGLSDEDGDLVGALLTWTNADSLNYGLSCEIRSVDLGKEEITLLFPMPYDIAAGSLGDEFEIVRSCDKRFSTCHGTFNNGINMRAEPWIPPSGKVRILHTDRRTPWNS